MTNQKLFDLYKSLLTLKGLSGVKLSYAIARNKAKIKSEIESLEESIKPTQEIIEYEKKRIELCELHADKDDKEKPITVDNVYQGLDGNKAFEAQFKVLQEENKELLDVRQKQIDEYNSLLKEESKLELYKIDITEVPKEICNEQMDIILPIINE